MSTGGNGQVRFGSAVRWATAMNWGQEGLSALVTFVLAMLLGPGDFGLVVLATSYTSLLELLVAQGFLGAIVQRKEIEDIDLDSVFWITLLLGAVLTLLAVAT